VDGEVNFFRIAGDLVSAVILTGPAPAFSSFNLDYVVIGRIWVPSLGIKPPREAPRGR